MPVRIFVADDHEIVREGVCSILKQNPQWEICGQAADGRTTVSMVEKLQPDVVIMDINMPELNGLDATRQIKRTVPATEILVFTANENEEIVRDVFKAGARSYLLKSDTNAHLVPAIEALLQHRTYFSSKVSEVVFAGYLKGEARVQDRTLTQRERELVQLIAEGKSNKEVASILGISIKTVETHRATVMRKLDLDSVADLVRYAVRNGIVVA